MVEVGGQFCHIIPLFFFFFATTEERMVEQEAYKSTLGQAPIGYEIPHLYKPITFTEVIPVRFSAPTSQLKSLPPVSKRG